MYSEQKILLSAVIVLIAVLACIVTYLSQEQAHEFNNWITTNH